MPDREMSTLVHGVELNVEGRAVCLYGTPTAAIAASRNEQFQNVWLDF